MTLVPAFARARRAYRAYYRAIPLSLVAAILLGAGLGGGTGCHYAVASDPNDPLHGVRNFAVEPVGFNGLTVGDKPEPNYLAEKKPEQQQSWQIDKAEMARLMVDQLAQRVGAVGITLAPPPPGAPPPFVLRINVVQIEPGNFNGFVNIATRATMVVDILNPQGQSVGQSPLTAQVPATLSNPSSGERLRMAGQQLGDRLGHLLLRRTGLGY